MLMPHKATIKNNISDALQVTTPQVTLFSAKISNTSANTEHIVQA